MENNRQNNSDDLLRQILTETSVDSAEEKRDENRSPFTANRTESRSEAAAVVHEAAPVVSEESAAYEERTTVHKAAKPEAGIDMNESKTQSDEDSLYSDLDGISQTQIHKKKQIQQTPRAGKRQRKRDTEQCVPLFLQLLFSVFHWFLPCL